MTDLHAPHRPPHAAQLEHARHHARSALSALRAIDLRGLSADQHTTLSQVAAQLADAIEALSTEAT